MQNEKSGLAEKEEKMKNGKWITDVHTHSNFSPDGVSKLQDMFETAQKIGIDFYGVSEHFSYDFCPDRLDDFSRTVDEESYYHTARHLQEDYAGVMNVLVGAEFGFSDNKDKQKAYLASYEKYRPDFVVNSVHSIEGVGYSDGQAYYTYGKNGEKTVRDRLEVFREYLALIRRSLDVPYPYDIVGHIGYSARYAPYLSKEIDYAGFAAEYDDILKTIIRKEKILEINAAARDLPTKYVPVRAAVERYYELGGRKVSYASDAHSTESILRKREDIVNMLKEIGFTYLTVPCRGEHIKIEI